MAVYWISDCCNSTPIGNLNDKNENGIPTGNCRGCGKTVSFRTANWKRK